MSFLLLFDVRFGVSEWVILQNAKHNTRISFIFVFMSKAAVTGKIRVQLTSGVLFQRKPDVMDRAIYFPPMGDEHTWYFISLSHLETILFCPRLMGCFVYLPVRGIIYYRRRTGTILCKTKEMILERQKEKAKRGSSVCVFNSCQFFFFFFLCIDSRFNPHVYPDPRPPPPSLYHNCVLSVCFGQTRILWMLSLWLSVEPRAMPHLDRIPSRPDQTGPDHAIMT